VTSRSGWKTVELIHPMDRGPDFRIFEDYRENTKMGPTVSSPRAWIELARWRAFPARPQGRDEASLGGLFSLPAMSKPCLIGEVRIKGKPRSR